MTPERKAEVNRRLAEFGGYKWIPDPDDKRIIGWFFNGKFCSSGVPDYTTDLNALARLVRKDSRLELKLYPLDAERVAEDICQYLEAKK